MTQFIIFCNLSQNVANCSIRKYLSNIVEIKLIYKIVL